MSTLHQMIQTVESSDPLTFTDSDWKERSEATRDLLLRGADQGYFKHDVSPVTIGEGADAITMEQHSFALTDKGRDYMKKARGEL